MGQLIMLTALILPVASGALRWPLWMILVCGTLVVVGFFMTNFDILQRVHARGRLLYVIGPAIAANSVVCAALFGIGHLLRRL